MASLLGPARSRLFAPESGGRVLSPASRLDASSTAAHGVARVSRHTPSRSAEPGASSAERSTRIDSSFADLEIEASRFAPRKGGARHRKRRPSTTNARPYGRCRTRMSTWTGLPINRPAHQAHLSRGIDSRSGTRALSCAADLGRSRGRPTGTRQRRLTSTSQCATERAMVTRPRRKRARGERYGVGLLLSGEASHRAGPWRSRPRSRMPARQSSNQSRPSE
jgi:hypothetical protein